MKKITINKWWRVSIKVQDNKMVVFYHVKDIWSLAFEIDMEDNLLSLTNNLMDILMLEPLEFNEKNRFLGLFFEHVLIHRSSLSGSKATDFEDVVGKIDVWIGGIPYQIKTTTIKGKGYDEVLLRFKRDRVKLLYVNIHDNRLVFTQDGNELIAVLFETIKIF